MNYQRLHDAIIADSRLTSPIGYKHNNKLGLYKEKHHIIPRCMAGTNAPENLVYLTARRHFIIHRLLTKIYPNNSKIWYAFHSMFMNKKYRIDDLGWAKSYSKNYEILKIRMLAIVSGNTNKRGKSVSEETRLKMSIAAKNRIWTEEHRKKLSIARRGRKFSEDHKRKISEANKNKIVSKETRLKMSIIRIGKLRGKYNKPN